jgi:hypothetical protein
MVERPAPPKRLAKTAKKADAVERATTTLDGYVGKVPAVTSTVIMEQIDGTMELGD